MILILLSLSGPPVFLQCLVDQSIDENKPLSLCVTVSSKTDVKIKWFLDENTLVAKDNLAFKSDDDAKVYSLAINSVSAECAGKFSVVAENNAGSTRSSCLVQVNSMYQAE